MKRYKRSFYYLFVLFVLATRSRAQALTLNVNFEKPVAVIGEKFLSLTVDPSVLLHGSALSTEFEESVRLAKALSPAYVRFGGPHGTFFQSEGSSSREDQEGNRKFVLSAESKPEKYKSSYLGALVLARRLGNATKSKVNVFMRQPSDLTRPTPDYWVSLLHKTLVGGEVFETKIQNDNGSHVYLYCQCAKASSRYEKGSVVIFGANLSPEDIEFDLKGTKITTLHKYVLLPGFDASNRMFAKTVLLNNEPLTLTNGTVPDVKPAIARDSNGLRVNLPSTGIGFWVLPDFKIKSCMETSTASDEESTRIAKRVPRDLRKTVQDIKIRVAKSAQDVRNSRNAKRKVRNESRSARKPNARRELEQLKDFVRKKLDEYEGRITSIVEGLPGSAIDREHAKTIGGRSRYEHEDDTGAKLAEFKDRLTRMEHLVGTSGTRTTPTIKGFIGEAVAETVSLISKIQNARSSSSAVDYLESLYRLLTRASLTPSGDHSANRRDRLTRATRRSKRDVFGEIAADSPWNPKKEIFLRKMKSGERGRVKVRPSVVELEKSDSGENTFYGFFETIPLQGFPEGDVFVTADYDKDNAANDREAATVDNDGNNYRSQLDETGEYFVNRAGSAELWEAETYRPRDRRATRKNTNLYEFVLDEEMVNEDDANSKDCDCRVIRQSEACDCRTKRNPLESLESETNAETSHEQEMPADSYTDVAGMNSHEDENATDVEVFSKLADSPMEILKLDTGSPNSKIQRDANELPLNQFNSEIVGNLHDSLDDSPSTVSTFDQDGDSNSPSYTAKIHRDDSPSTMSTFNEDGDSNSPSTKIHRDENTFFGETEQEETSTDALEDTAEYTRRNYENSTPVSVGDIVGVAEQTETPRPEETIVSEAEGSSTTLVPAISSDESIVAIAPENDYDNDTTVEGTSKRPVETEDSSGTTENEYENPETLTSKSTKQDRRRVDKSSSKGNKSSDARPWETRLMNRARALLARRKMLDEKKEKRRAVSTSNSKLRSTFRQRARNQADRLEESDENVREKRHEISQQSSRDFVNAEEIEIKTEVKKRKREANDDLGDTIDRIPIYNTIEANANRENDASSETVKTTSVPITEIARMRNVRERIFNGKDPQNFRHSGIVQLSDPREPTDAIIRSRDLVENETATKRKFSNDEKKYDRSYLALVENLESPRIFHYQGNPRSEQKRSLRVLSPNPDASYYDYDTEHTYDYDSLRSEPYENLEIVQDSSDEIEKESNEFPVSREIYVIDPSEINAGAGEPALKLLYGDPLKTRKVVYETIWKPVLYNPYKIRQTNQLERENGLPGLRDPRGKVDHFEDLVKLRDPTRNLSTGELLRILIDALDLRYADQLFERLTGSKESQSRDETTRLERDNELKQIPESKETSEERKLLKTSDTQTTQAQLSMVHRDTPDFLENKHKSEVSGERFDYANENTSEMLRVYTANQRDNENSETIEENEDIEPEMATTPTSPWTMRLGRFRRQTFDGTKVQPLELQRLEEVPSSPRILTHSDSDIDIDDVEKSMVRKIAHEKNMPDNYENENRGLSSFVKESIPKLQSIVVDGLEETQNLTGTVERLIDNLDKNFDETSEANGPRNSTDLESISVTQNTFHNAIINVNKFFKLLTGITHILH